jgi:hypothetical protein
MALVMTKSDPLDIAAERVLAYLGDPELEARYPNHTHFVAADNPQHEQMANEALLEGHPVVIVYPDGRELLIRPEMNGGTRTEARDRSGKPIAA